MLLIYGHKNIKFGKVHYPKGELPYIKITILPEKNIVEAGSVIWDTGKKRWEIRSRKETAEMVENK
jgi:hypothetical protein